MHQHEDIFDPAFKTAKIRCKKCVEKLFKDIETRIEPMTREVQKVCKEGLEDIYRLEVDERNYNNTVLRADRLMTALGLVHEVLTITAFTHHDAGIQTLANQKIEELSAFSIDAFEMNRKLYKAFDAYNQRNAKAENILTENTYFLKECMERFKRNGLHLEEQEFKELQSLKKEISKLENDFEINIREDNSGVWMQKGQLEGIEPSVLESLKTKDNLLFVGVDYPTYTAVMQDCKIRESRKKLYLAYMNRAFPKNNALLDELRKKRDLLAKKLGFHSFTDLDLSDQMIKNSADAYKMIRDMAPKLQKKLDSEKKLLKSELSTYIPEADKSCFEPYDLSYLLHQYKKDKLAVDEQKISEYFPFDKVLTGLFDIYSRFFDLKFSQVTIEQFGQEVPLIKVEDGQRLVGFIGLDLFPRKGKYSHACCCMVLPPHLRDGVNDPALAYIIANFTPATKTRPSLLKHGEVQTLYHEFGHALHALVGTANNMSLAGYNTKIDFVELPSQILEEWLYEPEILELVSCHYQTGKPLEKEMLDKKIAAKTFNTAHHLLRQIALTEICLEYFSDNPAVDTDQTHRTIMQHYLPHIQMHEDNNFVASFGHLSGYGAKYYSYLYSKILALDLFSYIKQNGGLLNSSIGKSYLEKVISQGGRSDPHELIVDFLSRQPSDSNFLKTMGVF
jgi:thimet oligopeptidase